MQNLYSPVQIWVAPLDHMVESAYTNRDTLFFYSYGMLMQKGMQKAQKTGDDPGNSALFSSAEWSVACHADGSLLVQILGAECVRKQFG
jgi:hypothetical protein